MATVEFSTMKVFFAMQLFEVARSTKGKRK
jgi:hypothetical protein